jgi:VanZ family protein
LKKPYLFLSAAITWFIVSVILFTLPGTAFPQENWLDEIYFDKWVHIGIFTILVTLWCLALYRLKPGKENGWYRLSFFWIAMAALAYGIAIEFIQKYFIPFRSFDYTDMIADGAGCLAGWIFCSRRYIKK